MNKKILILVSILVIIVTTFFIFFEKTLCMKFSDDTPGEFCYKKSLLSVGDRPGNIAYLKFLSFLGGGGNENIIIGAKLYENYGERAYKKMRDTFKGLTQNSVKNIIINGMHGAILLEHEGLRLVLYFDVENEKVLVKYDTHKSFLPLDIVWVNGDLGITEKIEYSFPSSYCAIEKGGAFIRSDKYELFEGGSYCQYASYNIYDMKSKFKILPVGMSHGDQFSGTKDSFMRFLSYMSKK